MIKQANLKDATILAQLAQELWPHHALPDLIKETQDFLAQPETAYFLAFQDSTPIGFAQCQLRHDYVEGTTTSPVGYLEGIYVQEEHRKKQVATHLLQACQNWAKEKNCREFASDCELDNEDSLRFHLAAGFIEANRIICFTKSL
jgi:aminoglycoside 6'-N-acetyltransferase I